MKLKISQKTSNYKVFIVLAMSLIITSLCGIKAQSYVYYTEMPRLGEGSIIIEDTVARFVISYNAEAIGANFVAYKLCKNDIEGESKRKNRFFSDPRLIEKSIPYAKNSDYSSSGYDRGHMLPSGDRKSSQRTNDATFSLANCLPQTPQLNRGTWKQLEESLRQQISFYDTIYIVTGVVADDSAKTIGKSGIHVPQSFFKAFVRVKDGQYSAQAYIMPNSCDIDPDPLKYRTTIDQIELLTNMDLFVNLEDSLEQRLEKM